LEAVFGIVTIALALLAPPALPMQSAKAVTGTWSGTLIVTVDGKATDAVEYVHTVLKQIGSDVSGTAGADADHQYPIRKGTATTVRDVTTLTFEFIANGVHTSFNLKSIDGLLRGDARIVGEDGHAHTATAELKPVKSPAR
jgi:hypothetical protein